jgi:prephenate dehydrogenase
MPVKISIKTVGILGFGAFGRLIARHLRAHFELVVSDPELTADARLPANVRAGGVPEVGRCDLVILATPIEELAAVIFELRPHLRPGSVVTDVVSVKVRPVKIMQEMLPPFVDIIGTHPLFGPQSARDGIAGRKISICPVRGRSALRVAAFLRRALGLKVYITTPEEHDKEAAIVQGITHLIAKVLVRMEPLPDRLTTASFDKLIQATDMVRDDPASVFLAIERDNPFSAEMRQRFFAIAEQIKCELEEC